jgi:hypothetical protein
MHWRVCFLRMLIADIHVYIPDSVTDIRYDTFHACSSLTCIHIPERITTIGHQAFRECSSLISITIPENVSDIGVQAFSGCSSLTSIVIPKSVTTIGFQAFVACDGLDQRQLVNGCNYHEDTDTWICQQFDNLPLHQMCYNDTSTLNTITFNKSIQEHASMIITNDAMLMTPLHILCCNPTATTEMIVQLQATEPQAASMENVMNKTPLMILLESKQIKYNAFQENGQLLPVVGLLEQGLDYNTFKVIWAFGGNNMRVLVSELEKRDETSGLLPFMYGASLSKCRLDIVYELAMVHIALLQRNSKKRRCNSNDEYTSSSQL